MDRSILCLFILKTYKTWGQLIAPVLLKVLRSGIRCETVSRCLLPSIASQVCRYLIHGVYLAPLNCFRLIIIICSREPAPPPPLRYAITTSAHTHALSRTLAQLQLVEYSELTPINSLSHGAIGCSWWCDHEDLLKDIDFKALVRKRVHSWIQ